jgi:competence protein ComEC
MRLRYGKFTMLMEGDAEVTAEQAMWKGLLGDLPATVLKAGHHGSCTASGTSYLHAVNPQYVMISAGLGNSYGLPHCQTLTKLKAMQAGGLRWARTDMNGSVSVVTDGSHYAVVTEKGAESDPSCPENCAAPLDF